MDEKTYRIKPLEWVQVRPTFWKAMSLGQQVYAVAHDAPNRWTMMNRERGFVCDSLEHGQQLATEHWSGPNGIGACLASVETIELTDEVRQSAVKESKEPDSAIAYLVFDNAGDIHLFEDFRRAENFAERRLETHEATARQAIDVYPLYASHPIEIS